MKLRTWMTALAVVLAAGCARPPLDEADSGAEGGAPEDPRSEAGPDRSAEGAPASKVGTSPAAEAAPAAPGARPRAEPGAPAAPAGEGEGRMEWFNDARFGMFIHWGVYSVPAGEWKGRTNHAEWIMLTGKIPSKEYEKFVPQFNPVKFDAAEWVALAKDAGMKYMVITSKHHDGFCMYDTALTDYSIVKATPYGRDPMKDLAAECAKAGLRFCFYYSNVDWHHLEFPAKYSQRGFHGDPNPQADLEKYVAYMKGQVRELLTNYGAIGIMWFDGGGSFRNADMAKLLHSQEIIDMIREIQPACLVNNRLRLPGDYGTPEQHIPGKRPKHAFEVCMTLNRHWGYNKHDMNWKEPPEVVRKLVDIASKGGNFLLNVGPTAEGLIPADSVRILREVGRWLRVNGESIYGTEASPFDYTPAWGRVTARGKTLYLHVFERPREGNPPAGGKLRVERLKTPVVGARLLADEARASLPVAREGDDVVVSLPGEAGDPIDTVVVLELAAEPRIVPKATKQAAEGALILRAADAIIHGETARYEEDKKQGKDNIGFWTKREDWLSWFVEITRTGTFAVEVTYACPGYAAGSEFTVAVGESETRGKVEATASWTEFRARRVGTIELRDTGRTSLSLRPVSMPGFAVMNLKSVTLKPE